MTTRQPLATGYIAPLHGRGAMGFFLLGLLSLLVFAAGLLSPSLPLVLFGFAGMTISAAGYFAYWRVVSKWPLVHLYADRIEVVRGPQRGVLAMAEVTGYGTAEYRNPILPFLPRERVLTLATAERQWQFGPEIAGGGSFQDEVVRAVNAFHSRAG